MDARRIMRIVLVSVATLSLVVVASGCQRAAERVIEERTGVAIDADEDRVTITGPEGEEVEFQGGTGSVPDGWPADLPVYEPAEIQTSSSFSTGEGRQMSVSLTTDDPFSDVFSWHKESAEGTPWEIENEGTLEMGDVSSGFLTLVRGDAQASISVNEDEDGEVIITMVVVEP